MSLHTQSILIIYTLWLLQKVFLAHGLGANAGHFCRHAHNDTTQASKKKWLTIKFDSYISSVVEEDVFVQKLVAVCSGE